MDLNTLFPPMAGAFFGVISAFALNYCYQYINFRRDKKKYIKILRSEIDLSSIILKRDTVQLLPTENWTSLVNSGALKLFDTNIELLPLSKIYHDIQFYNDKMKFCNGHEWDFVDDETKEFGIELERKLEQLKNLEWFGGDLQGDRRKRIWQFWR